MPDLAAWTPLHARIHQTLRSRQLVERGQRLLMAVSGGQDSLCLAQLLIDLQPKWDWQLAIAHCDHGWRLDSTANAQHVARLAHNWQLPYYQRTAVTSPASEAAARQWRYQALTDIAIEQNYAAVLTGHTASDRAETLLYNLMRGSGADGLQALTWRRPLEASSECVLIRPLLGVTRAETAQLCQSRGLQVWEDSTNADPRYARNRIRLEVLPYLAQHFNPQVELNLAQTAELLRAEVEYLDQAVQTLWENALEPCEETPESHDKLRLHRSTLQAAPLALQRRLMRRLLQTVLPQQPQFEHIEKLVALIAAPNRSRTDPFPGGAIAEVVGAWIEIRHQAGED